MHVSKYFPLQHSIHLLFTASISFFASVCLWLRVHLLVSDVLLCLMIWPSCSSGFTGLRRGHCCSMKLGDNLQRNVWFPRSYLTDGGTEKRSTEKSEEPCLLSHLQKSGHLYLLCCNGSQTVNYNTSKAAKFQTAPPIDTLNVSLALMM